MKKIVPLILLVIVILLLPVKLNAFAETTIVNNLNNSDTINSTEETRKNNNNTTFDEFMEKLRKPSIPIGITLISLSGLMFLVGFWIKALQKVASLLFVGVVFGLFCINYGEYVVGWLFAFFDSLVEYF